MRILSIATAWLVLLAAAGPAWAGPAVPGALERAVSLCACEPDRGELTGLLARIEGAASLAEAREIAAPPVRLALAAVSRARFVAPGSAGLRRAEGRLRAGEQAIAAARSPSAVAQALGALTPSRGSVLADCHYTTGEIIAIVLGFILGIIPGLILLILLC